MESLGSYTDFLLTLRTTKIFHLIPASMALNKETVTVMISAIGIVITRAAASETCTQNILGDPFTHAMIKDKVFSFEF